MEMATAACVWGSGSLAAAVWFWWGNVGGSSQTGGNVGSSNQTGGRVGGSSQTGGNVGGSSQTGGRVGGSSQTGGRVGGSSQSFRTRTTFGASLLRASLPNPSTKPVDPEVPQPSTKPFDPEVPKPSTKPLKPLKVPTSTFSPSGGPSQPQCQCFCQPTPSTNINQPGSAPQPNIATSQFTPFQSDSPLFVKKSEKQTSNPINLGISLFV